MHKSPEKFRGGALMVAAGLVAALLVASAEPSSAGPFNWFGRNQQDQGAPSTGDSPGASGGGGGLFGGLFGGGRSSQPSTESQASELPLGDPEVAMILNPALSTPTLATQNIGPTKAAIEQYKGIVAQGGWPMVPAVAMRPGSRGQEIVTLHRRLEVSGDLVGMSVPDEYDATLVAAVKRFQARHGLPPTGVIDSKATVAALNVPATVRLAQLEANLKRLQKLAPRAANRYVLVNIPAAQVEAVENGRVIQRHAAVVGKPELPTPELSSKVKEVNFNPYWYVPRSIVQNDLVPKGREFARAGRDMLAAYHMQAFDPDGNPVDPRTIDWNGQAVYTYNYRQLPWAENSLGYIKINFPNKDAVYMHDTPLKSLFGKAIRYESHGCVRVHNVAGLADWLLQGNPGWDINRIRNLKQTGEQVTVSANRSTAVYFAYISAWATPDGQVHFRPDIYNEDGAAYASASEL
jgi:murein L,D-transpeptidase YcbB/YkuD